MSGIDILQEKIKLLVQGMQREKRNAQINYIMDRYRYDSIYIYIYYMYLYIKLTVYKNAFFFSGVT